MLSSKIDREKVRRKKIYGNMPQGALILQFDQAVLCEVAKCNSKTRLQKQFLSFWRRYRRILL